MLDNLNKCQSVYRACTGWYTPHETRGKEEKQPERLSGIWPADWSQIVSRASCRCGASMNGGIGPVGGVQRAVMCTRYGEEGVVEAPDWEPPRQAIILAWPLAGSAKCTLLAHFCTE
jgi:hypothetical protein